MKDKMVVKKYKNKRFSVKSLYGVLECNLVSKQNHLKFLCSDKGELFWLDQLKVGENMFFHRCSYEGW